MNTKQITRFKDAPWLPKHRIQIIIGGAGGISSWVTLFLSRVNIDNLLNIIVYDFDKIEEQNFGGQFYNFQQIGMFKTEAIKDNVKNFSDTEISYINEKYTQYSRSAPIMIAGFDNMEARKIMFEKWLEEVELYREKPELFDIEPLFIDGKLLAEQLQILCVTPDAGKIEKYKKDFMFSDKEVPDASCTFRQTSHMAGMIGSLITSFLLNHTANYYEKNNSREVPFYYEFFSPLVLTNFAY